MPLWRRKPSSGRPGTGRLSVASPRSSSPDRTKATSRALRALWPAMHRKPMILRFWARPPPRWPSCAAGIDGGCWCGRHGRFVSKTASARGVGTVKPPNAVRVQIDIDPYSFYRPRADAIRVALIIRRSKELREERWHHRHKRPVRRIAPRRRHTRSPAVRPRQDAHQRQDRAHHGPAARVPSRSTLTAISS